MKDMGVMKQIVIISGKGGTGKTVITGAFAFLSENIVLADCDVDAADLHLLLQPEVIERQTFESGKAAFIDKSKCSACGKCIELCRYEAISENFIVDHISCEGCGFCHFACPVEAILMRDQVCGEWFVSKTRFGPFVHAKLGVASENSGKLVSLVRQKAKKIAEEQNADWIIIDGAPGIGCPVIASLGGIDIAVVVTEPTLSGLHDANRVIRVAGHFKVPVKLIINKYDLNLKMTEKIENEFKNSDVEIIGKLKFDKSIVDAVVNGKTIMEYANNEAKDEIQSIWEKIRQEII